VGEQPFPLANLRVDWADDGVVAMRALWNEYRPQIEDYVTRAIAPDRIT
jgi:hypothetical protein